VVDYHLRVVTMCPRGLGFTVLLLALAMPVRAQVASVAQSPDISRAEYETGRFRPLQFDNQAMRIFAPANDDRFVEPASKWTDGQSWHDGAMVIGPLSMDVGSSDTGRDGKASHFAHLHLDNVHVLGGDVSGTFDGRAATLRLSWHTEN
jgi:hypothetical protein